MLDGRSRWDAAAAALFGGACAWLILLGRWQAQLAVAQYGHNVDSGVMEWAVACLYLAPAALLFTLAALAGWRHWRFVQAMRWLAVAFALLPIILGVPTCIATL